MCDLHGKLFNIFGPVNTEFDTVAPIFWWVTALPMKVDGWLGWG